MEIDIPKDWIIEVNIADCIDQDEREQLVKQAARNCIVEHIQYADLEKAVTNACYDMVIKLVREKWQGDFDKFIVDKVRTIIKKLNSYEVFGSDYTDYSCGAKKPRGRVVLEDEVRKLEGRIRERAREVVEEYDFSQFKKEYFHEAVADVILDTITKQGKTLREHYGF